jgi:hypothetical protein
MALRQPAPRPDTTAAPPPPEPPAPARPHGRRRLAVVLIAAGAVAVVAWVAAVAVASRPERSGPPAAPRIEHAVSAPRGDRADAEIDVLSGAGSITVRAADLGTDLYRVETPPGGAVYPQVAEDSGRTQLRLGDTGRPGPSTVTVLLNATVRWTLHLAGGAGETRIEMRDGRLAALELAGGADRIEVSLPRPEGTTTVRVADAARELVMHAAAGAPTRVRLQVGSGSATIDGDTRNGTGAGTVIETPGWGGATDRYDIDVVGGVGSVTLDRS